MADRREFAELIHHWPPATVLLVTFLLTLMADLAVGITAGCVVAAALHFLRRDEA